MWHQYSKDKPPGQMSPAHVSDRPVSDVVWPPAAHMHLLSPSSEPLAKIVCRFTPYPRTYVAKGYPRVTVARGASKTRRGLLLARLAKLRKDLGVLPGRIAAVCESGAIIGQNTLDRLAQLRMAVIVGDAQALDVAMESGAAPLRVYTDHTRGKPYSSSGRSSDKSAVITFAAC